MLQKLLTYLLTYFALYSILWFQPLRVRFICTLAMYTVRRRTQGAQHHLDVF